MGRKSTVWANSFLERDSPIFNTAQMSSVDRGERLRARPHLARRPALMHPSGPPLCFSSWKVSCLVPPIQGRLCWPFAFLSHDPHSYAFMLFVQYNHSVSDCRDHECSGRGDLFHHCIPSTHLAQCLPHNRCKASNLEDEWRNESSNCHVFNLEKTKVQDWSQN